MIGRIEPRRLLLNLVVVPVLFARCGNEQAAAAEPA